MSFMRTFNMCEMYCMHDSNTEMKDTIFWNEDDRVSRLFVQKLKQSGLNQYVNFTSFHVHHPKEQAPGVNQLLQILEVTTLPTLFYQGQAFHGNAAFEWLAYQASALNSERHHPSPDLRDQARPNRRVQGEYPPPPPTLDAPDSGGGEIYSPFQTDVSNPTGFGDNPFNVQTSGGSRGGISDDAIKAAEHERKAQLPGAATRM